jgi:POT family proton-dependent oligopeptide transporter
MQVLFRDYVVWVVKKISWSWGFGLAGVFMLFGMLQFYFTQDGDIGLKPTAASKQSQEKLPQIIL